MIGKGSTPELEDNLTPRLLSLAEDPSAFTFLGRPLPLPVPEGVVFFPVDVLGRPLPCPLFDSGSSLGGVILELKVLV